MRILYLASNPTEQVSLALEREMTELQRRLMAVDRLGTIVFKPLPHLKIDELSTVITEFRPDVVHLSVHGHRRGVVFADGEDEKFVTIPHFVAQFKAVKLKPKLVYLSACDGDKLAKALSEVVPFVLAMTDKVTNEAAIRSAVKFYEWLGGGSTIQEAYDIARPLLETVDEGAVSSNLHAGKDYSANIKLVEVFRMMACFTKLENTRRKKRPPLLTVRDLCDRFGKFEIEAGFVGCPRDTVQLVMFTTDDTFIDQETVDAGEDWIESQMSWILREPPVGGEIWFEHETIESEGDCRMYGIAVTSTEECATVSSTLTEALQRYYLDENYHPLGEKQHAIVLECIKSLILNQGPRARRALQGATQSGAPRTKKSAKKSAKKGARKSTKESNKNGARTRS
jgi:hypothetical protein